MPRKMIILKNLKNEHYHLPKPPNFIRRVSDDFPVPYGELSDEQIRKVGKAWTDNLLARAAEQREQEQPLSYSDRYPPRRSFNQKHYGED